MKKLIALIGMAAWLAQPATIVAQSGNPGFVDLFNGKDLSGWVPVNETTFQVNDGNLRLVKGMGWLRTEKQYRDFVLEFEWRALVEKYDSGIFFRAGLEGKPWPNNGWQVNLRYDSLGGLVRGYRQMVPSETPKMPLNQWVKTRITVKGKTVTLDMDGERAWEYNQVDAEQGYLGIQAEDRAFDFRNIRIQELAAAQDYVVFEGKEGPGKGKHIVLVSGDEEYRSEECLPMMAKILAQRHGFKCTVLFGLNPTNGIIDPTIVTNIGGMEVLPTADMMVLFTRFRELPDNQMKYFVDFVNSGKPILGLRTATHAFAYSRNPKSPYAQYSYNSRTWPGGFGQQVLGETWVNHHGYHGKESTRGVIHESAKSHPILKSVSDIWGPTDVYTVTHLPKDAEVLVWGQVLEGMKASDKPLDGPKNNPMMPMVWLRNYTGESGKTSKIISSTFGSSPDFQCEDFRRLVANACYWALGLEAQIPARADVSYVGEYKPTWFGFAKHEKGLKPGDHALKGN